MKQYGLIGKSLSHSFSPVFFKEFFEINNISAEYKAYEIETIKEVKELLSQKKCGV